MEDHRYKKYEPIWGSWYIQDELGHGSEGSLYRVRRRDSLGNEYYSAVKAVTIPKDGEKDIEYLIACGMSRSEAEDFYRSIVQDAANEFDLMEKLKGNSNIVSYEDHAIFERDEDFGWDILIRIEELTPLVQYTLKNQMTEKDVLKMGRDICRGLKLCNQYDIVHRDIKPENIFVSPSGEFKLGDFGIARIIEKTQKNLSRKGTYNFMAPEVYLGKAYSGNIDIYSLGIVMYMYMNDGRFPFMPYYPEQISSGDQEDAFLKRIKEPKIPPPRNGSERTKEIILKACAFNKDKRYKNAEEMLADIEDFIYEEKHNVSSAGNSRMSFRSKLILAAVLLLAAVGLVAYMNIPKEITGIEGIDKIVRMYIGEKVSPEYKIRPDYFEDEKIGFSSGDKKVFTVDKNGRISAVSPGEAVLTMQAKGYKQESLIKVSAKVTAIKGVKSVIRMTEGSSVKLKPRLIPKKFADEKITYKVKNKSVAKVSSDGRIKALSPGTTKLIVSAGGYTGKYKIIVSEPAQVSAPSGDSSGDDGSDYEPSYNNDSSGSSGSGGSGSGESGSGSGSGGSGSSGSGGSGGNSGSGGSGGSGSGGDEGTFDSSDDEYF